MPRPALPQSLHNKFTTSPKQRMDMEFSLGDSIQSVAQRPLVLAVDDNEDNLILISFTLELVGCAFLTADTGETAIALAQSHQPDLILLDIMLPDLNGIEIVTRLRQDPRTKKIPIVAVTALARAEDRANIIAAGCNDYITKPYVVDDLEVILRRYLN
ncbi:response regulator [Planktothrix sp. FACHB-1355]|nr:response regulator [Planktothrix sp. FACHB-1355]